MKASDKEGANPRPPLKMDLIDPQIVETDYDIPENTQAIWRHHNRYGWGNLVLKLGSRVRYRRSEVEKWIEARRVAHPDGGSP